MRIIKHEPLRKRIPVYIDRTVGIQAWDEDNLYPQRSHEVRKQSHTTKIAVKRLAGFLAGKGFQDLSLASLVVNREGDTLNDVLRLVAFSAAFMEDAYVLHFRYNLNGQITEIIPVPIEQARFGMPDSDGDVFDIKISNNWERDPYKNQQLVRNIYEYPVYNPNPEIVKQQIEEFGIAGFPGQILFKTNEPNVYPEATFDAVFDHAQTQGEIGIFNLSAVQNGFTATTIFKYPGKFNSDDEKYEFKRKLNDHKGSYGANSTIVLENEDGSFDTTGKLIENLNLPNTDKMYEATSKETKNAIRENFSFPMEILGSTPEAGMFNKESIAESFEYVNAFTEENRDAISRQFRKIMMNFVKPITQSDFKITPLSYGAAVNNTSGYPGVLPNK